MLKITTLGTSHGDPTGIRFNTSTLLQIDNESYLIDAGAPVNALLIRMNFKFDSLKAIFLSHMHEDHVGGLTGMVKTLAKHAVKTQHTDIFFPEKQAVAAFINWLEVQHRKIPPEVISYHVSRADRTAEYNTASIEAVPTDHLLKKNDLPSSFAYKFDTSYGKVLFTGDLRFDFADFPADAAGDCRICVCELTHYPFENALPFLEKCNFEKLIFTHIGDNWADSDGLRKLSSMTSHLPYPCVISNDFEQFEFN